MFSLAGIFRRFWSAYRAKFRQDIPAPHVRAAEAILRCRTPEAGMVYYRCGDCGTVEPHPVSCGHRACNACGQHKSKEWEARQKSRLLPVPYDSVAAPRLLHPSAALRGCSFVAVCLSRSPRPRLTW